MLRRAIVALANELGDHILIECERTEDAVTMRIAGPTSVSENTLTLVEAAEVYRQLGYVLTT